LARAESLRAIAEQYGVHHSTIAGIYQESEQVLTAHWTEKSQRKGRPAKASDDTSDALTTAASDSQSLQKELALKQMRIDFLELKLQWERERATEHQLPVRKQFKKKKK
jgi:transposase